MKTIKKPLIFLLIFVVSLGVLAIPQEAGADEFETEIQLGYVQWACAEASTHLMQETLSRVGYEDVETVTVQAGAMYQGLASGDIEAITTAWLPNTHKSYWETYSDNIEELGTLFEGARLGLVVPEYVEVDTIEELNRNGDKFDQEIIGIDPGAGIMELTSDNIKPDYDLENWDLQASSGPAMTATLERAIEREEPIVVTGWAPHWKWAAYDLKFLEDPKTSYGEPEKVKALGRQEIQEDLPTASAILKDFELTSEQLGTLMNMIREGMEPEAAAEEYVDNNLDLVNSWLPAEHQLNN